MRRFFNKIYRARINKVPSWKRGCLEEEYFNKYKHLHKKCLKIFKTKFQDLTISNISDGYSTKNIVQGLIKSHHKDAVVNLSKKSTL